MIKLIALLPENEDKRSQAQTMMAHLLSEAKQPAPCSQIANCENSVEPFLAGGAIG